jgi:acetylornithine deacetylase/succinyl-diaminopimelate desuccinylase-like protein
MPCRRTASGFCGPFGVARPTAAFPRLQQALQYPTLNVRGLVSAHVDPGARTIIPDRATAAIDLRLVKETKADDLIAKLRAHIEKQGYHLVDGEPDAAARAQYDRLASLRVTETSINAFRTAPDNPQARAITEAIARAYGADPVRLRTLGGTVPISPFIDALGFPAVIVPLVNFDNNQHEENENLRLGALFDGIVTVAAALRM